MALISCNDITLKHSSHEKILGVTIDNKLSFDEHIINICKTANKKLNALSRTNRYMKQNQKKISFSPFIISHFSYCPLIGTFCSKKSTKKVNAVHEGSLRIIRNNYESLYPLLLEETHQIIFHQRCINSLIIKVYKYLNGYSPDSMNDIFKFHIFQTKNRRSPKYGLNVFPYRASQLWQQVPIDICEAASLTLSKIALRLGNVKIVHADLVKYLFKMSGISD